MSLYTYILSIYFQIIKHRYKYVCLLTELLNFSLREKKERKKGEKQRAKRGEKRGGGAKVKKTGEKRRE